MISRWRETLPRWVCGYPGAAVVLAAHFLVAVWCVREKSNAFDEIAHIAAGFNYWTENDYRLHPENGNLPQRWFALPLLTGEFRCPKFDAAWDRSDVWTIGNQFFYCDGNEMESLLWRARAMNAFLSVGVGFLVYAWSRRLFGPGGGILSLACYATSPTILANGSLATSDLAAAAFFTLAIGALWRLFHDISPRNIVFAWLALAGLFLSKMSAGLIVPMGAALLLIRLGGGRPLTVRGIEIAGNRKLAQMGVICGVMLLQAVLVVATIWAFYGFRYSAFREPTTGNERLYKSESTQPSSDLFGQAIEFARANQLLPDAYLYGATFVFKEAQNRQAFLNSEFSFTGWWYFFPYTFLVKTPPAFFLLLMLAVGGALWHWRSVLAAGFTQTAPPANATPSAKPTRPSHAPRSARSARSMKRSAKSAEPPLTKLSASAQTDRQHPFRRTAWEAFYAAAPLWVLLTLYWATAIHSNLNIGHRHLLPTYPAMFILVGAAAHWFERRDWLGRLASAVVLACVVGLAADCHAAFPHYLAYFNRVAGGSKNGYKHLVDSSLDWGQDLAGLKRWLSEKGLDDPAGEPVYLSYAQTASPEYYQIRATNLRDTMPNAIPPVMALAPGWYCLSATDLQCIYLASSGKWSREAEKAYRDGNTIMHLLETQGPIVREEIVKIKGKDYWDNTVTMFNSFRFCRLCAFLRQREPDADIGHSILIYHLTAQDIHDALFGPPTWLDPSLGPVEEFQQAIETDQPAAGASAGK